MTITYCVTLIEEDSKRLTVLHRLSKIDRDLLISWFACLPKDFSREIQQIAFEYPRTLEWEHIRTFSHREKLKLLKTLRKFPGMAWKYLDWMFENKAAKSTHRSTTDFLMGDTFEPFLDLPTEIQEGVIDTMENQHMKNHHPTTVLRSFLERGQEEQVRHWAIKWYEHCDTGAPRDCFVLQGCDVSLEVDKTMRKVTCNLVFKACETHLNGCENVEGQSDMGVTPENKNQRQPTRDNIAKKNETIQVVMNDADFRNLAFCPLDRHSFLLRFELSKKFAISSSGSRPLHPDCKNGISS